MTKFCTNCGRLLDENASLCMQCGKLVENNGNSNLGNNFNQNNSKKGMPTWLVILIIVFVILGGIGVFIFVGVTSFLKNVSESEVYNEIENIINNNEPEVFGTVGDTISNNTWKMTLKDAVYYDKIDGEFNSDIPNKGKGYLVFLFEAENISSESEYLNYLYFSGIEDQYIVTSKILINNPEGYELLTGEIPSGIKINGYIAFEVNERWQNFSISYKNLYSSDADLTFNVISSERKNNSEV